MARAHVVQSLAQHLSEVQAHALEHACHVSASAGASYERTSLRCLHLLAAGHLSGARLLELGPQALASAPLESFVSEVPVRAAVCATEEARARSAALLKDLTQADLADALPDAGVRCKKCGSNDVANEFLQTRSADEGTTIFCTCLSCKKRWKM